MSIITLNLFDNQEHDFILQNIPGDGDCGYTAFANWWNLKIKQAFLREDSLSLRRKVSQYINDYWEEDWIDADGNTIKLKEAVKHEIEDREKSNKDFSKYQINFDLETEDDDTIKAKYCNFVAEPRKLWISNFEFSILEKIFNKKVFVVNRAGKPLRGDLSEAAAVAQDSFYTVYNGVHYDLLINIKQYIADSWLKLIQYNTTVLNLVAFYTGKSVEWLQNQKNNILEELLKFLHGTAKEKLTEFYKELGQFFKKDFSNQEKVFKAASVNKDQNLFEETFKFLFDTSSSEHLFGNFTIFFARIKILWHKITVMFNPGVELENFETSGKYEEYGKYKDIFEIAQEPGRKFYRKVLSEIDSGEKLTDKQFLNKFLHALKHDPQKLFSKNGNDICIALDEVVLGDENSFVSNIEQNLQDAFKHYRNNYPEKDLLIKTASSYAKKLRDEIKRLKQEIIDADETAENKNKLFQALQYDRIKLVHFALKMQAFSKGETLTNKKSFKDNFKKYLDKLLAVKEIVKLEKNLREQEKTEAAIQNELKEKKASEFNKYNIRPCGIFNLFKNQNYYNKFNVDGKLQDVRNTINKERSEQLQKRKKHFLQEIDILLENTQDLHKYRHILSGGSSDAPASQDSLVEQQLLSLQTQLEDFKTKIDSYEIGHNISEQQYNKLLSNFVFNNDYILAGFKNTLAGWYQIYTNFNLPYSAAEAEQDPQAEPEVLPRGRAAPVV